MRWTFICPKAAVIASLLVCAVAALPSIAMAQDKAAPPAALSPAATYGAMPQSERIAIQSDLAWTGNFSGGINGDFNERSIAAVKSFQKRLGARQTGILNPHERELLAAEAKKQNAHAGWSLVDDPVNGIRLGVPLKLTPKRARGASGSQWSSAQGQIRIETWRLREPGLTIAAVAEREKKLTPPPRNLTYSAVRPDSFVLAGLQGLKRFYVLGQIKEGEVRGLTVLYDQATEGFMEPVVIAMSNAFTPFPSGATSAPPPRSVDYATAIVVSADGTLLAPRAQTEACRTIVVPGHGHAERVAVDKGHDLALLRLYGAHGLTPFALADIATADGDLRVTGLADPDTQAGGTDVSTVKARATAAKGDIALSPAPGPGFSGGLVTDAGGHFVGMAQVELKTIASSSTGSPNTASVTPAKSVLAFLASHDVTRTATAAKPANSVVRIVCVRR